MMHRWRSTMSPPVKGQMQPKRPAQRAAACQGGKLGMPRSLRGIVCLSFACAATLGLAACGGDDKKGSAAPSSGGGTSSSAGSTGGTITTAYTSFPDFLDPALSYTQE